jgi:hypothetical protein
LIRSVPRAAAAVLMPIFALHGCTDLKPGEDRAQSAPTLDDAGDDDSSTCTQAVLDDAAAVDTGLGSASAIDADTRSCDPTGDRESR